MKLGVLVLAMIELETKKRFKAAQGEEIPGARDDVDLVAVGLR